VLTWPSSYPIGQQWLSKGNLYSIWCPRISVPGFLTRNFIIRAATVGLALCLASCGEDPGESQNERKETAQK
jgi:hypothetical protein